MPWKGIYAIFLNHNFLSFWGQNVATVWKSHDLAGDELSATSFRSLMEKYAVRNGAKENTPTETWLIKYNWQQAQETVLFRRYFLVQMSFCSPPSDVVLFSLLQFLFQAWWNFGVWNPTLILLGLQSFTGAWWEVRRKVIGISIGSNQVITAKNLGFLLKILLRLKINYISIRGTEVGVRYSQELVRSCFAKVPWYHPLLNLLLGTSLFRVDGGMAFPPITVRMW